jgi:ribosome-binding factor A
MSQRTERIDELLRQEITELLSRSVADPRIGFVTITRVDTAPDLSHAKVWVSIIGQRGERSASLQALRGAMPYIRHQLGERVRLRRVPDLHVELDDTAERGTRVLQILHELEEGRVPEDAPPPGETLPTPMTRLPQDGEPEVPIPAPPVRARRRPAGARPSGQPPGGRAQGSGGGARGAGSGGPRTARPTGPKRGGRGPRPA